MKSLVIRKFLFAATLLLFAGDAFAVPAFARRYEVKCSFCHDVFPKLNRTGERFRDRGFRLENEEPFNGSVWIERVPVSGRLYGTRNMREGSDGNNIGYLKVLSAGNLGKTFSYWVDDAWLRAGGNTTHIEPDNAWGRFDFKDGGKLYAKAGRFELDLPFTQTRTPHLQPYVIYNAKAGLETDSISQYQEGVEVGGALGTTHLSAAVVKGRNNSAVVDLAKSSGIGDPGKFDGNLFLRASRRLTTAKFGAFAYVGRNDLVAYLDAAKTRVGVAKDNILRIGIDGSVWIQRLNLYAVGMYGTNSNAVLSLAAPTGTDQSLSLKGGFLAADYHWHDWGVLTARVQTTTTDTPTGVKNTLTSFLPGVQVVIWKIKLSGEANFSNNSVKRFVAIQAETAF